MRKLRSLIVGLVAASALSGATVAVAQTAHAGSHHAVALNKPQCTMGWPVAGCGKSSTT